MCLAVPAGEAGEPAGEAGQRRLSSLSGAGEYIDLLAAPVWAGQA